MELCQGLQGEHQTIMKPALLTRKPRYPRTWEALPSGLDLKQIVEHALTETSRQMFGYHFLKLGDLSCQVELPHCPIKHVVHLSDTAAPYINVQSQSHELPFAESSVDAVLLAHELDFAQDPHQILREIDRVIIPNGNLVIVGFSPLSFAWLLKYLPINPKQILHDARFFSATRIKDWLHLLGFEVIDMQRLVFSELFFERKIRYDSRWQVWCQKYMPLFSSLYIIQAKKRVLPLSLIKPKWKPKPNFSTVGASMRNLDVNLMKKNLL